MTKKTKKTEDGLIVHERPHKNFIPEEERPEVLPEVTPEEKPEVKPEPEEKSEPKPEPIPQDEPEVKPEEKPEEAKPEEKPADAFKELIGKIHGAEVPPKKEKIGGAEKPLIESTKKKKGKKESSSESFRVEGYVLLLVTDTVFPFALSALNNMLDKRVKIQSSELQLTPDQFSSLEPLADQAADYLAINLNPVAGFFIIATFMYGNNLLNIRMEKTTKSDVK